MIRVFSKEIDHTTEATRLRDIRTLENQVNEFCKQGTINPTSTEVDNYTLSGAIWYVIKIDYDQTPK